MKSKYERTVEQLTDKMSIAIEQCLAIIEQDIPSDISEDKMHNVLKGKRQATEDAIYYAREIDKFEKELSGDIEDESDTPQNNIKKFTKK